MHQQSFEFELETERLITSAAVRRLCGDVSAMSIWRWQNKRGFPLPHAVIGQRNFWRIADVLDWIDEQARQRAEATERNSGSPARPDDKGGPRTPIHNSEGPE